jgi:divalent metal cation (Fe/Co/Zn/Cd) transporter
MAPVTSNLAARSSALRRATKLELLSLGYNLAEAIVGVVAGAVAGSVALVGFGLDSVVESSSAAILLWRLRGEAQGHHTAEEAERRAVRLVALAFFALSGYVAVQATINLVGRATPDTSPIGIALALASVVIMPVLAARKRASARELDSRSMQADSRQTSLCTYMSAFLLAGLVSNALFGWWWADPLAALVIAGLALWRTEDFCCV